MKKFIFDRRTQEVVPSGLTDSEVDEYIKTKSNESKFDYSGNFPAYIDAHKISGVMKPPAGFNSLMKKIKKANRGSTIQTGNLSEI